MPLRKHHAVAAIAFAATCAALPGGTSQACYNEVHQWVDPRIQTLASAEHQSNRGDHKSAVASLAKVIEAADQAQARGEPMVADEVARRATALFAVAVARSGGMTTASVLKLEPSSDPVANVRAVVPFVRAPYEANRTDPTITARFAEVLSHVPEGRAEAHALLAKLEAKDVLTSAHGYAALAKLRKTAGEGKPAWLAPAFVAMEAAPRAVSLARCARMAPEKSICGVDVTPAAPAAPAKAGAPAIPAGKSLRDVMPTPPVLAPRGEVHTLGGGAPPRE